MKLDCRGVVEYQGSPPTEEDKQKAYDLAKALAKDIKADLTKYKNQERLFPERETAFLVLYYSLLYATHRRSLIGGDYMRLKSFSFCLLGLLVLLISVSCKEDIPLATGPPLSFSQEGGAYIGR